MLKNRWCVSLGMMLMSSFLCAQMHAQGVKDSFAVSNRPVQSLKTVVIDAGHGLPDGGAESDDHSVLEADVALGVALKLQKKMQDSLPGVRILMTRSDRNLPAGLSNPNEANRWRAKFANENHGDLFIAIHVNDGGHVRHSEIVDYTTDVYYTGRGRRRKRHTVRRPVYHTWTTPSEAAGTEVYIWSTAKNDSKTEFIQNNSEFDEKDPVDSTADSSNILENDPTARIAATLRMKKYFERSRLLASYVDDEFIKQGRLSRGIRQRPKGIWVLQATAMPSILVETGFIGSEVQYLASDAGQEQLASAILKAVVHYKESLSNNRISAPATNNGSSSAQFQNAIPTVH